MQIEPITEENIIALTTLILDLWTDCSFDEEYENCKRILTSETETCYLTKEKENYIAFIYISIRTDYVEGSTSSPVAYLEGLYVKPAYRKRGVGRKLVELGEAWGKQKGCMQFASDVEINNQESLEFHKKTGFKEVNRVVCLIKELL